MVYIISITEHKDFPIILGICTNKPKLIEVLKGIDFSQWNLIERPFFEAWAHKKWGRTQSHPPRLVNR